MIVCVIVYVIVWPCVRYLCGRGLTIVRYLCGVVCVMHACDILVCVICVVLCVFLCNIVCVICVTSAHYLCSLMCVICVT